MTKYIKYLVQLFTGAVQPAVPKLSRAANKWEFGLECYKQVRAEVAVLLGRIENLFRYSLLVSAGVYSWLLTQAFGTMMVKAPDGTELVDICFKLPDEALRIAWLIPTAFILLSGAITIATHIRILEMAVFLRMCECALGDTKLSWEVYLQPKPPLFSVSSSIAWVLMLLASICAAWIGLSIDAALCPPK